MEISDIELDSNVDESIMWTFGVQVVVARWEKLLLDQVAKSLSFLDNGSIILYSISGKIVDFNELLFLLHFRNKNIIEQNSFTALGTMLLNPEIDVEQVNLHCSAARYKCWLPRWTLSFFVWDLPYITANCINCRNF